MDNKIQDYKNWDKKLLPAFKRIPEAEQPLRNLIKAEQWEEIEKIASGEKEMVSILSNYYSEDQD